MKKMLILAALAVLFIPACAQGQVSDSEAETTDDAAVSVETSDVKDEETLYEAEEQEADELPATQTDTTDDVTEATDTTSDAREDDDSDYYAVATSFSKSETEAFAADVRAAFLDGDADAVAALVSDPVTVNGVSYSSEEFENTDIFAELSDEFFALLEQESCTDMFCNWQGIMLGGGKVWIAEVVGADGGGTLRIISINGA